MYLIQAASHDTAVIMLRGEIREGDGFFRLLSCNQVLRERELVQPSHSSVYALQSAGCDLGEGGSDPHSLLRQDTAGQLQTILNSAKTNSTGGPRLGKVCLVTT